MLPIIIQCLFFPSIGHFGLTVLERANESKLWFDDNIPQCIGKPHQHLIIYDTKKPFLYIIRSIIKTKGIKKFFSFVINSCPSGFMRFHYKTDMPYCITSSIMIFTKGNNRITLLIQITDRRS